MPPEVPNFGQIALLLMAVACFIAGAATSVARLRWQRAALRIASKGCIHAGIVLVIAALVWHCRRRHNWLPLEDNFEALASLGLLLALLVAYVQRVRPIIGLDWFIMPIAVLLLLSAVVFGLLRPDIYHPESIWRAGHMACTFGGFLAFAVAAAEGCMYLVVSARLRRKIPSPGPFLGNLERLENVTQLAVHWGFALLTLGLLTGLILVLHAGSATLLGPHWMTSPKVVLGFSVWIVYALALHTPINSALRGRKSAMLSIVGFVLMFGTLVAVQFVR